MKQKRFMSILLTLSMIFSMALPTVFADNSDSITVNVSIVQNGQFVTGKNETMIAYTPITVTDRNEDGYDIDDVLYATHELYYDGEDGYSSEMTDYGLSLTKLWGDESGAFGYYQNNQPAMSLGDTVTDKSNIYAFVYQDKTAWSDTFSYFESDTQSVEKGQTVTIKLNKLVYDENWATVVQPFEGAKITIDGGSTEYTTNAEGIAEIVFENTGSFTLSAISDYNIAPPVCIVNVTENGEQETLPPAEGGDDTDDSNTQTDKVDYNIVIPDALEKISATYKDATSEWVVMDMGAWESYAPETENKLTNTAKQNYINYAINTIKNSSSDTAIDKAVLGLCAISKNPCMLYSVNSNTAMSAIDKLNETVKSTSAWNAPYTLAVYNQGDYDTEIYETEIVDALLESQEEDGSWNEYGTIDTTANVIAGLSFYKHRQEVEIAIEKAVNYLSEQQNDDGTFSDGYSGPNSNSTAMVIIGLCASGVDLVNDPRFIKNEKNIIDGLLSFLVADRNGFGHTNNERINPGATEQAFRALIAFMQRVKTNTAYNIYDFSNNEFTPARWSGSNSSSSAPSRPSGENITVTMTIKADTGYWLNNYKVILPEDGATVYHAFVKACRDNAITYTGAENGYISSMTKANKTLSEFDKGEASGWLYKVNDELPTTGFTDYSISDGDAIVWYYTEDWTRDPSAGNYGGSIYVPETENRENNEQIEKPKADVNKYTDIKPQDWYYNDVKKALEIGLLSGVSESLFAPGENMTRGMIVTVLYRYDGEKGYNDKSYFADCIDKEWYSDAVYWASENNIVAGYGNGLFGTEDSVTRQQLITILYRYTGTKTEADLSDFADSDEIEPWAEDAMMWAVSNGIIFGNGNLLNPNGYATRAETTAIFMRYINTLNR